MKREEVRQEQDFNPFLPLVVRSHGDALKELLRPCGRFRFKLPTEKRLSAFVAEKLDALDPLYAVTHTITNGVPLNWQMLLRYLHQENVLAEPRFYSSRFRNDMPKSRSVTLVGRKLSEKETGSTNTSGHGSSMNTLEEAMSKAVGELLERHFFAYQGSAKTMRYSPSELASGTTKHLDIETLNAYLPWQTERSPWFARAPEQPLSWVEGVELTSNKKVLMPTQLVFWKYEDRKKENALAPSTTSGSAGHFTREEAILGSLLENIQRDGFLIYWLNMLSPKVIDVATSEDPRLRELLAYVKRYRLEIYFLDITTDLDVPSVACAVVDTYGPESAVAIGAAAGFDPAAALLQAAQEAVSVYVSMSDKKTSLLSEPYVPFSDHTIARGERLTMWRGAAMLERFRFFVSGEPEALDAFARKERESFSVPQQINYILEKFRSLGRGYEAYCYEVRNPVLETLGYHVVKTIVPQLMPLYLVESLVTLDAPRLREVPKKLGLTAATEYNPWPHPFP